MSNLTNNSDNFNYLKISKASIIAFIILLGIYARFIDLSTHFSHGDDGCIAWSILNALEEKDISYYKAKFNEKVNDTRFIPIRILERIGLLDKLILLEMKLRLSKYIVEPLAFTGAPLQFLFTANLLNLDQTYREILFWGRFPSFVFSIIALIVIALFYRSLKKEDYFLHLICTLTILALSWQNIIYAKQMQVYSVGVLCAILILYLLLFNLENINLSYKRQFKNSILLTIFTYAQYQSVILTIAFYITSFFHCYSRIREKSMLIKNYILGLMTYIAMILPGYFFFARDKVKVMITYDRNLNKEFILNEYILDKAPDGSIVDKIYYGVLFLFKNSLILIESNCAVVPEKTHLRILLSSIFISLFLIGMISLFVTKNLNFKVLGYFFLIVSFLLVIMVVFNKHALYPTRHNLILLPYQAFIISEGIGFCFIKIKNLNLRRRFHCVISIIFSLLLIISFFIYFERIVKERRDKFDENELFTLINKYKVSTIISYAGFSGFGLMLFNKNKTKLNFNHFNNTYWQVYNNPTNYDRIAFISYRSPLNKFQFDYIKSQINANYLSKANTLKFNYNEYKFIYSKEINSIIEQDFSYKTKNGTNGFFFYVLEKAMSSN